MPLKGKDGSQTDYFIKTESDVFNNSNDGGSAPTATATIVASPDLGRQSDSAATSNTGSFSIVALLKRLLGTTLVDVSSNLTSLRSGVNDDLGRRADTAATSNTGEFSVVALLKRLLNTTLADVATNVSALRTGVNNDLGQRSDSAATTNTGEFSVISLLKRLLDTTLSNVSTNIAALRLAVNNDNRVQAQILGSIPLPITDNGSSVTVDNNGTFPVQVNNQVSLNAVWGIPAFDRIALTYDGQNNVTSITYGRGNNTNIATLSITYSGGNIATIIRNPALSNL